MLFRVLLGGIFLRFVWVHKIPFFLFFFPFLGLFFLCLKGDLCVAKEFRIQGVGWQQVGVGT